MNYIDELEADDLSNRHDDSVVSYENDSGCCPPLVTCKYCGNTNLYWKETKDGWRTANLLSGQIHHCPKFNKL